METNKEKKKGNLLMWLLLIFFPLIGIIYMWISKKEFSNNKKSTLTIIFAAWFFIVMAFGANNNTATDTSVSSSTDTETQSESSDEAEVTQDVENDNNISDTAADVEYKQTEKENSSEETPEEEQPPLTEEEKEAILEADAVIWNAMLSLDTAFASFSDVLNNNPNLLDLYDSGKALHDAGYNSWKEIIEVNYDGIETYKESAESYALLIESIGDDVEKYANKNEVSYLSSAKNNIESKETFALKVVTDRVDFLTKAGLSIEEITSLLDNSESTE